MTFQAWALGCETRRGHPRETARMAQRVELSCDFAEESEAASNAHEDEHEDDAAADAGTDPREDRGDAGREVSREQIGGVRDSDRDE